MHDTKVPRDHRLRAAGVVVVFLVATWLSIRDPEERALAQYHLVIAVGYGHLIGALTFALPRMRSWIPAGVSPVLFKAFVLVGAALGFASYSMLAAARPEIVFPLLAVSMWHIVENEFALKRSYRDSRSPASLPLVPDQRLEIAAITALLLMLSHSLLRQYAGGENDLKTADGEVLAVGARAAALAISGALLLRRRSTTLSTIVLAGIVLEPLVLPRLPWIQFADLFSAITLYHLVGWLVVLMDRARAHGGPRGGAVLAKRLLWVHAPPLLVCAGVLLGRHGWLGTIEGLVFSPGIYLFWSCLHVVQTTVTRHLARRPNEPMRALPG